MTALAAWALLVFVPSRRWARTAAGVIVPAIGSAAYAAIILAKWSGTEGGFSSLQDVARLFSDPWLLLAGWLHYLAFDLLVGGWEVRDAQIRQVPHLLVVPCLALTFMFGPAGWLLYLVVRQAWRRRAAAATT
jgi:hypothetical protein